MTRVYRSKRCKHGNAASNCARCAPHRFCKHKKRRTNCKECGGSNVCTHGKIRGKCMECGGAPAIARAMLSRAKAYARKHGQSHIAYGDLLGLVLPMKCPVFGTPFVQKKTKGSPDPDCASIDKFYPQLGYVNGNVSVISRRANTIKGDSRSEQVLRVALWMHLRQKGLKPSFEEVTNLLNEVYDFLAKT